MEIVYLSAEEMRRKTEESERRAIRDQDTQLKKLEGIIKSLIHRPDSVHLRVSNSLVYICLLVYCRLNLILTPQLLF